MPFPFSIAGYRQCLVAVSAFRLLEWCSSPVGTEAGEPAGACHLSELLRLRTVIGFAGSSIGFCPSAAFIGMGLNSPSPSKEEPCDHWPPTGSLPSA